MHLELKRGVLVAIWYGFSGSQPKRAFPRRYYFSAFCPVYLRLLLASLVATTSSAVGSHTARVSVKKLPRWGMARVFFAGARGGGDSGQNAHVSFARTQEFSRKAKPRAKYPSTKIGHRHWVCAFSGALMPIRLLAAVGKLARAKMPTQADKSPHIAHKHALQPKKGQPQQPYKHPKRTNYLVCTYAAP